MRRFALMAALALSASAATFTIGTPAFGSGVACGDTVSSTARLRADLHCSGEMLTVAGEGTVLDLGGRTVSGAGILVTGGAVTIRSGSLAGAPDGSDLVFVDGGATLRLDRVRLSGSAGQTGVMVDYGAHAEIRRSDVRGFGIGVDLFGGGPNSMTASTLSGNRVAVHVDRAGNTLHRNLFDRNGVGVWITGRGGPSDASASVAGNVFARHAEVAVRVTGAADPRVTGVGGEVARNWILAGRGVGVEVDAPELSAALALSVNGNVAAFNSSDGIRARGPAEALAGAVVVRNHVLANGGHGIDAPGVTDGGGNAAILNRLQPQCIGVVCR